MEFTQADALRDRSEPPNGPLSERVFPKSEKTPRAARTYVRSVLTWAQPPVSDDEADDVCLIVSELVTNAVRYGTEPGDSVRVRVLPSADRIRVEVHDPRRKQPRLRAVSTERVRGRGLHIVRQLAAQWGVDERPFGKSVWAEVRRCRTPSSEP